MIARNCFSKLLQGPHCCPVRGDIAVQDRPNSDFHEEEYIKDAESGGHHHQKVTGGVGLLVIADEGTPVLRGKVHSRHANKSGHAIRNEWTLIPEYYGRDLLSPSRSREHHQAVGIPRH